MMTKKIKIIIPIIITICAVCIGLIITPYLISAKSRIQSSALYPEYTIDELDRAADSVVYCRVLKIMEPVWARTSAEVEEKNLIVTDYLIEVLDGGIEKGTMLLVRTSGGRIGKDELIASDMLLGSLQEGGEYALFLLKPASVDSVEYNYNNENLKFDTVYYPVTSVNSVFKVDNRAKSMQPFNPDYENTDYSALFGLINKSRTQKIK